jgi:hypothetical protein
MISMAVGVFLECDLNVLVIREFHCAQKSVTLELKRNLEERLRHCQQILRRYQHEVGSIGGILVIPYKDAND